MVRNCGCSGSKCTCAVDAEGGMTLSGNGTSRLPYIPRFAMPSLVGQDSSQSTVSVTGSGTSGDPWVVEINTLGGTVTQTVYNNDDTWVKQGGTFAQVIVIGGGGGGGSCTANAAAGGSGGSGGAMSVGWFPLADLPDSIDLKVGQGGAGGEPFSGFTTAGNGGDSWFGEYLYAGGGRGGKSQASSSQTPHTTVGGTPPEGGPGGAGAVRDGTGYITAEDHVHFVSPTGGGMGMGVSVGDLTSVSPGFLAMQSWGGSGGKGGATGTPGPVGRPGLDGSLYGGGGGGGAASPTASWEGGAGAPGVVVVTVW